ncbi:MAG: hypothetical protein MK135_09675, partial [Polyangiaceae bacterium]|nr:hypothetical protein [Polyangiaceae bacterium]
MIDFIERFLRGADLAFAGLGRAARCRSLRRVYLWLTLFAGALNLLFLGLGIWALFYYLPINESLSQWEIFARWIMRGIGSIVLLLVATPIALVAVNTLFGAFAEIPFYAVLEETNPQLVAELKARAGLSRSRSILYSLRRLGMLLFLLVIALVS